MNQSTTATVPPVPLVRLPWRAVAFAGLLAAYVLLIIGVVHQSPLLTIDHDVWRLDLRVRFPQWYPWIHTYVMLGQRAPSTLVALPWFLWMAWRYRSARPLITLGTALLALNLSVGVVKLAIGRLGPLATHQVHAVFDGGNIFPSGHTSNAVVLYGVIAMLAVSYRTAATVGAVVLSITVGLSTIYLDTHWLTDVVGGWMAGGLVLLLLPTLVPRVEWLIGLAGRPAVRALGRVTGRTAQDAGGDPAPACAVPAGQLAPVTIEPVGTDTGRVPARI